MNLISLTCTLYNFFSTLPPLRPSIFTEKMIPALPDKKDDAVKKQKATNTYQVDTNITVIEPEM